MRIFVEPLAKLFSEIAWNAAVRAEREACAKVCDEAKANIWEFHPYEVREAANSVCTNLAAAIRARGQE
jgi:hypothetical protein